MMKIYNIPLDLKPSFSIFPVNRTWLRSNSDISSYGVYRPVYTIVPNQTPIEFWCGITPICII